MGKSGALTANRHKSTKKGTSPIGTELYKTLDKGVNFAAKALQHMNEKARQVPVQVLIEAIKNGAATQDPRGSNATMYYTDMIKNGVTYTLEVLYDKATNTIQHFMYYHK